jgi:hypothetical protein
MCSGFLQVSGLLRTGQLRGAPIALLGLCVTFYTLLCQLFLLSFLESLQTFSKIHAFLSRCV